MMPCSAGAASTSSVPTRVTTHQPASSARFAGPRRNRRTRGSCSTVTRTWCRAEPTAEKAGLLVPTPGEVDAAGLQPVHRVGLLAALGPDPDLEVQVVAGALALAADQADE